MNDSLIEEIKSIPGVTDVMTREIVSVNLNGTRFPAAIVSKKDFDFMRQDGDIGSMDYDQAVKNGEIFFGSGQRGWNKMDMLRMNPLHLTLRMEVEPIPIRERLQDPLQVRTLILSFRKVYIVP